MKCSKDLGQLYAAMVELRKDIKPVIKSKQGYGYKYATLESVQKMLDECLPKHGLGYMQFDTTWKGKPAIRTHVFHAPSGQWIIDTVEMTDVEISKANEAQEHGASQTYFRRYTLSCIFGISTEEDVDGNLASAREHGGRASQIEQKQPAEPQATNPLLIIRNDWKSRISAGWSQEAVLKTYADFLKTDLVKEVKDMSPQEQSVLANELQSHQFIGD